MFEWFFFSKGTSCFENLFENKKTVNIFKITRYTYKKKGSNTNALTNTNWMGKGIWSLYPINLYKFGDSAIMHIQHDSALWNQTWQCERRDHCTCCGPMRAEHESYPVAGKHASCHPYCHRFFIHTAIQRLTHLYHRLGTQPERSVSRSSIQRCGNIRWTCRSRTCGSFTDTKVWTGWINIIEHLGKIWINMDIYI